MVVCDGGKSFGKRVTTNSLIYNFHSGPARISCESCSKISKVALGAGLYTSNNSVMLHLKCYRSYYTAVSVFLTEWQI